MLVMNFFYRMDVSVKKTKKQNNIVTKITHDRSSKNKKIDFVFRLG